MDAAPVDNGMGIGGALLQNRRDNIDALLLQGLFRFLGKLATRGGVDNGGGRGFGETGNGRGQTVRDGRASG